MSKHGTLRASARARKVLSDCQEEERKARKARQKKAAEAASKTACASVADEAQGGLPDWVKKLPPEIAAKIKTVEDAERYRASRDYAQRVAEMGARLRRRGGSAEMDAFAAVAKGLEIQGLNLRSMAPTKQLAILGLGHGRNKAVLTRKQLAASMKWHQLWMETRFGAAAVDPEKVRVSGGGGGDTELGMIRAAESARDLKRLRAALSRSGVNGHVMLEIVDWVIEKDEPLQNFSIAKTLNITGRDMVHGARLLLLTQGLEEAARQLRY